MQQAGEICLRPLWLALMLLVRYLNRQERWEWEIDDGGEIMLLSGMCDTPEEAKAACEAAWHELLMRDVLEGSK